MTHFIIHRGLIISIMQFVFSILFYDLPMYMFNSWLIFGFTTFFTSLPAISILLNEDITKELAFKYEVIYKPL